MYSCIASFTIDFDKSQYTVIDPTKSNEIDERKRNTQKHRNKPENKWSDKNSLKRLCVMKYTLHREYDQMLFNKNP